MKIRVTKTGESGDYVHLNLTIAGQSSGAILVPRLAWETFEETDAFMLDAGQSIDTTLHASGAPTGEPDRGGSERVARRDDG